MCALSPSPSLLLVLSSSLVWIMGEGGGVFFFCFCHWSFNHYWQAHKVCKQYHILHFILLFVMSVGILLYLTLILCITLTLTLQDSGPFSHRTMFRSSKLKLIGLGSLRMVPIRSLLWHFRLGILGRTLKVVLPSACPVFFWSLLTTVRQAVPEVHPSVCKVVAPHVETVPWFLKFQGVTSGGSHHDPGDVEVWAWHFVESM